MSVKVEGVTKRYGDLMALEDVTLRCPSETVTGLIGPNGAGKSTMIHLLAGLFPPTAGHVAVMGHRVDDGGVPDAVKERTGYLLEDEGLFDYLTGWETLRFIGASYGLQEVELDRRIERLATFFQLEDSIDRVVDEYSRGTRKKLALAGALVHGPRLLILDEPFESLDPLIVRRVKEELSRFARSGGTVLLSSHLLDVVEEACDRIAVLIDGRVRVVGDTEEAVREVKERLPTSTLEQLYSSLVEETAPPSLDWIGPDGRT